MKIIIEFDTDNPDDKGKFERFCQCDDLYGVVWEFLRNDKYDGDDDKQEDGYHLCKSRFVEYLEKNNVNIDLYN